MTQELINWVIGGFGALISFLLTALWQSIKDLQRADIEMSKTVAEIQVLLAGGYARREDVERLSSAIFTKLDRIEEKLDRKVDK